MNERMSIMNDEVRLWTPELILGIDIIDQQHRELIGKMEDLFFSLKTDEGVEKVLEIILFMQRYTLTHLATEEYYMHISDYPDFDTHLMLHNHFRMAVLKVKKYVKEHPTSPETLSLVKTTIINWFLNHIQTVDKNYGKALRSKDLHVPVFLIDPDAVSTAKRKLQDNSEDYYL